MNCNLYYSLQGIEYLLKEVEKRENHFALNNSWFYAVIHWFAPLTDVWVPTVCQAWSYVNKAEKNHCSCGTYILMRGHWQRYAVIKGKVKQDKGMRRDKSGCFFKRGVLTRSPWWDDIWAEKSVQGGESQWRCWGWKARRGGSPGRAHLAVCTFMPTSLNIPSYNVAVYIL